MDNQKYDQYIPPVKEGTEISGKRRQANSYLQFVGALVVIACIFLGGFFVGKIWGGEDNTPGGIDYSIIGNLGGADHTETEINFDLFWDVWNTIKDSHVNPEDFSEEDLFYSALRGLAAGAGDPVTVFLDPEQTGQYNEGNAGIFEGIGAELGYKNGSIIVVAPLEGSPALAAGLRSGDKIIGVDGEDIIGQNIYQVVAKIRGDAGTKVVLTIVSEGDTSSEDIEVTRGEITVPSVSYDGVTDGVAVIDVDRFTESSATAWQARWNEIIDQVVQDDPDAVLLDLRGNPGGYFNAAVWAAGEFLPNGTLVAQQYDRDEKSIDFVVAREGKLLDVPLVVLVNGGSASASEILAGALQAHERAFIIGESTYGKGTAQRVIDYGDGSSLHITTLKWVLPDGRGLDPEHVVEPDQVVEMTEEDFTEGRDPQLDTVFKYLNSN